MPNHSYPESGRKSPTYVIADYRNPRKNLPQIRRMQSRTLAFGRMCPKGILDGASLICTKTIAGCDGNDF